MPSKLIFIYNAKSGKLNTLIDSAHKIFSPDTYECNLCALTFNSFSENTIWKEFREKSGIEMDFLHTDEFKKEYNSKSEHKFTFPIVLTEIKGDLKVFISTKKMNKLQTTKELIELIEKQAR